ncbi:hypothetical protein FCOIX_2646 [Fusarium coicis]|nr:hypothetical protein FCOIX_2646 [Fusarium coicis]
MGSTSAPSNSSHRTALLILGAYIESTVLVLDSACAALGALFIETLEKCTIHSAAATDDLDAWRGGSGGGALSLRSRGGGDDVGGCLINVVAVFCTSAVVVVASEVAISRETSVDIFREVIAIASDTRG